MSCFLLTPQRCSPTRAPSSSTATFHGALCQGEKRAGNDNAAVNNRVPHASSSYTGHYTMSTATGRLQSSSGAPHSLEDHEGNTEGGTKVLLSQLLRAGERPCEAAERCEERCFQLARGDFAELFLGFRRAAKSDPALEPHSAVRGLLRGLMGTPQPPSEAPEPPRSWARKGHRQSSWRWCQRAGVLQTPAEAQHRREVAAPQTSPGTAREPRAPHRSPSRCSPIGICLCLSP